jgi:hypothetical protein
MAITIRKTIPSTSKFGGYTSGGDTTITLYGAEGFTGHVKKELLKIGLKKSQKSWGSNPTDYFDYNVVDLASGTDEISMKAYVEDDATTTAWEKVWKLRAMAVSGGPLTSLVIDNITFSSATVQAFLEDLSWTIASNDTGSLNTNKGDGIMRIELSLSFFIGNAR